MRRTLLMGALCCVATSLFSQDKALLQQFKYRINHYRALNLNFSGAGARDDAGGSSSPVFSNATAAVAIGFTAIHSSDHLLLTQQYNASGNYSGSTAKNDFSSSSNHGWGFQPAADVNAKWFTGLRFLELGVSSGALFAKRQVNDGMFPGFTNHALENAYGVSLVLGVGTGRLENITDMQNAIWLNKALEASGSLAHALTPEQLNSLGRSITRGNNTRVLDIRKRTQFVLTTVDSFFQANQLIGKQDIHYFSNLNDILFFAFNNQRLAGRELFIRLNPGIAGYKNRYEYGQNTIANESLSNSPSVTLRVGVNQYLPANLVHQNNVGIAAVLSYIPYNGTNRNINPGVPVVEGKQTNTLKRGSVTGFFQHAIYPNTRTAIEFKLDAEGGYQDFDKTTSFFGVANFNGSFNYFVSYRTRLLLSAGVVYQNNYYLANQYLTALPKRLYLNFNAGINVSI